MIVNIADRSLEELWMDPGYVAYRERLHNFVFAPAVSAEAVIFRKRMKKTAWTIPNPRSAEDASGPRESSNAPELVSEDLHKLE